MTFFMRNIIASLFITKRNASTLGKRLLFNAIPSPPSQAVRHASTEFRKSDEDGLHEYRAGGK